MRLPKLTDGQFMTAEEKRLTLKHWETFLKYGCLEKLFTKRVYEHLSGHCSFIAHYNREGFYDTYFKSGYDTAHFLSQFDDKNGEPASIEYTGTFWLNGSYADINKSMVLVARKYIPALMKKALAGQKKADVNFAKGLLAKYGLKLKLA